MAPMRLFLGALFIAAAATAHADATSESAIHYRQSVYQVIMWNFSPLLDMIKGKTAFDAVEFARRAERLAFLSQQLLEGFPVGSNQGAETDAKPEIWQNFDDFQARMSDFVNATKALSEVARSGDEAKMRAQFSKTSATCKACHDQYRAD